MTKTVHVLYYSADSHKIGHGTLQ